MRDWNNETLPCPFATVSARFDRATPNASRIMALDADIGDSGEGEGDDDDCC